MKEIDSKEIVRMPQVSKNHSIIEKPLKKVENPKQELKALSSKIDSLCSMVKLLVNYYIKAKIVVMIWKVILVGTLTLPYSKEGALVLLHVL